MLTNILKVNIKVYTSPGVQTQAMFSEKNVILFMKPEYKNIK